MTENFELAVSKRYIMPVQGWVTEAYVQVRYLLEWSRSLAWSALEYEDEDFERSADSYENQAEALFWSIYPFLEEVPERPEPDSPGSHAHNRAHHR